MQTPNATDLRAVLPTIILVAGGMSLLLVGLILPRRRRSRVVAALASLVLIAAVAAMLLRWDTLVQGFGQAVVLDNYSLFLGVLFAGTGIVTLLLSFHYLQDRGIDRPEYYALLVFSISGMTLMASANDLTVLFIALELLSIPLYVLAGFARPASESEESALKFFLLGAFSSAFLIYGVALIYGGSGTTAYVGIVEGATAGNLALTLAGAGLVLVGLAFKIAAVPFHMWAPDVFEGAPTPVTAFMSVGAKAAGLAGLGRIFLAILPAYGDEWIPVVAVIAALTMIVGNVLAISQTNIKRMLAYSSIAHAGYLLMGIAARNQRGLTGVLFYLAAYGFASLGAFAVLTVMAPREEDLSLRPYTGLAKRQPAIAAVMALFMFSLTGIPLTAGFIGKYQLFWAAVEANLIWLAIIGALTSVVSAFFYLRVVVAMYFETPSVTKSLPLYRTLSVALLIVTAGTLLLGLWPQPLLDAARASVWPAANLVRGSVGFSAGLLAPF